MIIDKDDKLKFAKALKENPKKSAIEVATELFSNIGTAIKASNEWINDPFVIAEVGKIEEFSTSSLLPTKEEMSAAIWERMQGTVTPAGRKLQLSATEFRDLARLYCEINGMIEKPQITNNTQVNLNIPKVISAPAFNSEDDWEKQVAKQQESLLNESATKH